MELKRNLELYTVENDASDHGGGDIWQRSSWPPGHAHVMGKIVEDEMKHEPPGGAPAVYKIRSRAYKIDI